MVESELKNRKNTTQKLILQGFASEDIDDISGLSVDLIKQIKKEIN